MLNLREYQKRATQLADYLPWAALVASGIVLNKDGSFQRTMRYRGPDLERVTQAELVAISARINDALKRFGSNWTLFFEAVRSEIADYPTSTFPDPASWLVDQERKHAFHAEKAHFETSYYLTLCYLPPEDRASSAQSWMAIGESKHTST